MTDRPPHPLLFLDVGGPLLPFGASSRLGLPELPVVTWHEPTGADQREDQWLGLCWKTRTLVNWAARRPFAVIIGTGPGGRLAPLRPTVLPA